MQINHGNLIIPPFSILTISTAHKAGGSDSDDDRKRRPTSGDESGSQDILVHNNHITIDDNSDDLHDTDNAADTAAEDDQR